MNQLQSIETPDVPAASLPTTPFSEPWLAKLRNAVGMANGRPILMSGCSIAELERARITGLIARHKARLEPGHNDRKAIAVVLAKLLAAFPAQAQSEAPAAQRVDAYFEALHGIPAWAVDEARKCIITGMAAECAGSFAPTPPQLAAVCRRMLAQDTKIIADLERILAAASEHGPSDAERERVSSGFDRLKADLLRSTPTNG